MAKRNGITKVDIIIPVKKISTRVREKNFKPFLNGFNLLQIKLWQTLALFPPENVIVSTDCEEAREIATNFKVRCQFTPNASQLAWAERLSDMLSAVRSEYMCLNRVTTPFLGTDSLKTFLDFFFSSASDSALTAVKIQDRFLDSSHRPLNFSIGKGHLDSQDAEPIYKIVCGFAIIETKKAHELHYHFGEQPQVFEVNVLQGMDINTPEDWKMAQALLEIKSFKDVLAIPSHLTPRL